MAIWNDATKTPMIVAAHAKQRWAERFGTYQQLVDSLKRAVPFGVQMGNDLLLRDGDAVFATSPATEYPGKRIVRTVMHASMAMANLRAQRYVVGTEQDGPTPEKSRRQIYQEIQHEQKKNEKVISDEVDALVARQSTGVREMSDTDLDSYIDDLETYRDSLKGMPNSRWFRAKLAKAHLYVVQERARRRRERFVLRLIEGEWRQFAESLADPNPAGAGTGDALQEDVQCR